MALPSPSPRLAGITCSNACQVYSFRVRVKGGLRHFFRSRNCRVWRAGSCRSRNCDRGVWRAGLSEQNCDRGRGCCRVWRAGLCGAEIVTAEGVASGVVRSRNCDRGRGEACEYNGRDPCQPTDRDAGLEHEEILYRFLTVLGRFVACLADYATENAKPAVTKRRARDVR